MTHIRKVFSKNLKKLRLRQGFTQEELAEKLDISTRYVQQLEGANCPNVKIETIALLAKALDVDPTQFLKD